ncbi:MAG: zinc-ribbon domain-containing protein, partial [Lachnospiraceae bacterium]
MKCPNCGTEIKDGNLYCEKCGEEIHIVPDFEPEIEYSMNKTLSGIVEDVLEEVPAEPLGEPDNEGDGHNRKHRKGIVIACLIVAVAIVVGAGTGAVLVHQNSSISYQISKANACLASGNIEKAITYYVKAVALDSTNISLQLTLADLYDKAGMEQEYLSCLTSVIGSAYISEDEMESAYKKLIAFYKSREDFASINTLLVNTDSETIRTMFQHYMAAPP